MKKIFLIFTVIVSIVCFSTKANAQYVDKQTQKESELLDETYLRRKALISSPEYQAAKSEIKTGQNLIIGGFVVEGVSALAGTIPIIRATNYVNSSSRNYNSGPDTICYIVAGVGTLVGGSMITIGCIKWYNGAKTKRAFEIVYNLNGVKVTF